MKVRNTRQGYATLHFKDGVRSVVYKIKAGEVVNIPTLNSVDQVVNKFLFAHGHLVEVKTSQSASNPEKTENTESVKKPSTVQKAKKQTAEYIADNAKKDEKQKSSKKD